MHELVDLVGRYGLTLVFINVLAEQVGLPIPAVPTLIVAGAAAAAGQLSAAAVFGAAVLASYIGDGLWFAGGRLYGRRVLSLLCRVSLSPDSCVRQSEFHFERWGKAVLIVSKFIPGLSAVTPPLAGAMRMGWPSFIVLNGIGIALWAGLPIVAGMLFANQIERVVDALAGYGVIAVELLGALLALYIAFKWWERRRFYRALRLARITVEELRSLIQGGRQPVVVDVRSEVARKADGRFIPGALMMGVDEIDARLRELPKDRDIIFYCTCPNEESAAHVAKRLIELGYTRVRPLAGGLDAWIAAGHPVDSHSGVT
ncbi:MAG TPA: DedA family protein/thiosulfate sulfurtransferase GlpE [Burkholderiales bacterium]|nr:DedA family protein/thiosulfate sulfurtransferase GlpE [Burkholderiales bacterium]